MGLKILEESGKAVIEQWEVFSGNLDCKKSCSIFYNSHTFQYGVRYNSTGNELVFSKEEVDDKRSVSKGKLKNFLIKNHKGT